MKEKYQTPKFFGETFNPTLGITLLQNRLDKSVLAENEDIPTLAEVGKAFGEQTAILWLRTQMQDLFAYVEQPLGVRVEKIREACTIMYHSYPYINVLEYLYFFTECKRAVYGVFFGQTGPLQVANMFQQYLASRNASIEAYERDKARKLREETPVINGYFDYLDIKRRAEQGDKKAIEELKSLINHGK